MGKTAKLQRPSPPAPPFDTTKWNTKLTGGSVELWVVIASHHSRIWFIQIETFAKFNFFLLFTIIVQTFFILEPTKEFFLINLNYKSFPFFRIPVVLCSAPIFKIACSLTGTPNFFE